MAVDYLAAVSLGVYSTGPANQLGICARFASWGLLTVAGEPAAAPTLLHKVRNALACFLRMRI